MGWERFYTAKSLEDTGKTVDEVEWSRRPDLTFYFLDAKGDKVQIDPEDGSFSPMWVPMSTCRFLLNSRACNAKFKVGDVLRDLHHTGVGEVKRVIESDGKILYDLGHGKVVSEDLLIKRGAILSNSVRSRNAKFKPGDKVTWQHHNGSYSNEVIDYIIPPNGYAFVDGGIGAEAELRAGWVPESQTGRANMPPLNSRTCNGIRSRNAVVAKALNACGTARNAGDRDMYEDAIRQAIVKCEAAIKYEPDADDYSDVTRLVKQAKDLLAKAYRAI